MLDSVKVAQESHKLQVLVRFRVSLPKFQSLGDVMVAIRDLKSLAERRAGSSPARGTMMLEPTLGPCDVNGSFIEAGVQKSSL